MGLIGCLLLALYRPGPLTLIPPEAFLARPAIWLRAISRKRATISVAPNFAYGLCVRRIRDSELEGVDLSSWRFALNGAEPVAPAVLRRFSDRFRPQGFDARALMPVYGLSEASLAVTFTPPGRGPRTVAAGARELASVGVPLPGVDVDVRQDRIFVRPAPCRAPRAASCAAARRCASSSRASCGRRTRSPCSTSHGRPRDRCWPGSGADARRGDRRGRARGARRGDPIGPPRIPH